MRSGPPPGRAEGRSVRCGSGAPRRPATAARAPEHEARDREDDDDADDGAEQAAEVEGIVVADAEAAGEDEIADERADESEHDRREPRHRAAEALERVVGHERPADEAGDEAEEEGTNHDGGPFRRGSRNATPSYLPRCRIAVTRPVPGAGPRRRLPPVPVKGALNRGLTRLTGYELRRSTTQPRRRRRKGGERGDRLLVAPAFVMCSVRSGSTLLRVLLDSHSQIHSPQELHLRDLSVKIRTEYATKALAELGLDDRQMRFLLWDRLLQRELA